jgi:predicted secreted protein
MSKKLNEQNYWQILEMVASANCDLDTDSLSEYLYTIAEGDADEKAVATNLLINELRQYLPDFASNEEEEL